jgi:copper chaperone NosL
MNKKALIIFIIAVFLLVLLYFTPIWSIQLNAPQYPEGIGLNIWINKITGKNPNDLKNINGLNHYIGMKEIRPDAIKELKFIPYIVGFMLLLGVTAIYLRSKKIFYIWVFLFVIFMVSGMVDFYLWEYDYGHNLAPNAAIKIPGMSYQPPLFGAKQLLNMRTTSLPHAGGILAGMSLILCIWAVIIQRNSTEFKK